MTNNHEHYRSIIRSRKLNGSDLHVWCVSLNSSPEDLSLFSSMLSQDERERSKRFYFENDRSRYILGRGYLRSILAGYLEKEPDQIELVYSQFGKPSLKPASQNKNLEFNLSHSNDLALYVFTWNRKVGVDVEFIHSMAKMDEFSEQLFSSRENALITSLMGQQKEDLFFKIWTCKEAFLKANGSGLTIPINLVDTYIEPNGSARLTAIGDNLEQAENWRLELFKPAQGFQAAIAINGHDGEIIFQH